MSALVTAIMQDISSALIIETTILGQWFSLLCCVVITLTMCTKGTLYKVISSTRIGGGGGGGGGGGCACIVHYLNDTTMDVDVHFEKMRPPRPHWTPGVPTCHKPMPSYRSPQWSQPPCKSQLPK